MKIKYRVLERKYANGNSLFFPQCHDWWHGWRFYSSTLEDGESRIRYFFHSLEEAKKWLDLRISLEKSLTQKSENICVPNYRYMYKEIPHPMEE
jgi:hypothetical protein